MRKRADFSLVLHARELDESAHEARQMTTAQAVGAVSGEAAEWDAINWPTIHRNVRRLQVRIAQATKERRWGKVQALQRLLTHSYSGKVLAVRRVTENAGKKTPGVDQEITYFEKREADHMRDTFRGTRTLRYLWYDQRGCCPVCNERITRITGWRLHHCVPVSWGVRPMPRTAFYFIRSAMTGFIVSV
jgi:hypothetical protein